MINNRIIPLKFNKKDFEEIYFRDNQGSLFFSPANKSMTITAIVFAIVLGFLYLFNLISIDNVGIYYFLSFIFLICILRLFAGISQTLRWKKGIFQYLKSFKNNTVFELELMDDFLIINIDYQEEYIQWKEFKKVELKSDYIFFQSGNQNYLFPKKAMTEEDYIFFKEIIKTRLSK